MSDPDYPLTCPQALRAAKEGAMIKSACLSQSDGYRIMAVFDPSKGVLVDHIWQDWVIDMLDYVPGGDYPLTYEQALDQAKQGNMVECSFGGVRYQYETDADCITCIDMEQPSDAERCCGWRIVLSDDN